MAGRADGDKEGAVLGERGLLWVGGSGDLGELGEFCFCCFLASPSSPGLGLRFCVLVDQVIPSFTLFS